MPAISSIEQLDDGIKIVLKGNIFTLTSKSPTIQNSTNPHDAVNAWISTLNINGYWDNVIINQNPLIVNLIFSDDPIDPNWSN